MIIGESKQILWMRTATVSTSVTLTATVSTSTTTRTTTATTTSASRLLGSFLSSYEKCSPFLWRAFSFSNLWKTLSTRLTFCLFRPHFPVAKYTFCYQWLSLLLRAAGKFSANSDEGSLFQGLVIFPPCSLGLRTICSSIIPTECFRIFATVCSGLVWGLSF